MKLSAIDRWLLWGADTLLGLTTFAAKAIAGRGERTLASLWPSGIGYPGGWSSNRLEQARHYRHWVYVGVRAIANEVARAKPQVCFQLSPDAQKQGTNKHYYTANADWSPRYSNAYTRYFYQKALNNQQQGMMLEPAAPDHPLVRLLANPNGPDTGFDFYYELIMFLCLTGNGFVWVVPNGLGLPAELWVIPSHWVVPIAGDDGLIAQYAVRPFGTGGGRGQLLIPAEEILHVKEKNPLNKIDGMSPLQAGAEWIDTTESVTRSQWVHFKEGAWPGVHIKVPGDPTDEELDRIYARFISRFSGELNHGKPIVTSHGAEVKRLTHTPMEMNYINSAAELRDCTLALLGVPKGVVGLEPGGDNISAYAPLRQFCRFTISPILMRLGATFTEKLGTRYPGKPIVWYADPTPDDPAQLNADISTDFACGAIDADEIRALRGRPPRNYGNNNSRSRVARRDRGFAAGE